MGTSETSNVLKPHLGGHLNITHIDNNIAKYMISEFNIKSMLDIGCGPGGMVELFANLGINAVGIDGDNSISRNHDLNFIIHDYITSPYVTEPVDFIWSCEFVEHVEEQYLDNFMKTFQCGKYIIMTYAPIGTKGHHHVNCNTEEYWISKFNEYGLVYDYQQTNNIRKISSMKRDFIRNNGLFFRNIK